MIIYHHNDLDGRCAAAIALRWAKKDEATKGTVPVTCIELDYKDKPDFSVVEKDEIVNIVDFSFKPEVMKELLAITENVFWIDHHVTAKDYPYQDLPGLRDFTDKGRSGCELAWKFFFHYHLISRAAELIGDYDKWALKFQPECFQFYEGLKMEVTNPECAIWQHLLFPKDGIDLCSKIIEQGKSAIRYRDNYCDKICNDFGYEIELDGHKGFATNFYQFGSKGFGGRMDEYDFCAAYIHDGKRFTVSLYSTRGVDVSVICKKYGGGGHRGAAGFQCEVLPFKKW